MSTLIYQQDSIRLDADRISEEKHPVFGDMTVFHNVVIASEMVQPYKDGKALKHRDELEAYSWTVDGRWIIVGGHPEDAIISDRAQVGGRTVNPKYVKNLKDPKTGRPNRAGVTADIQVFNNKISKQQLDDMKSGKKADVSIGFFYAKDEKAGIVEDGPFKGDAYDYVQRNMFHDHTAVGIEDGRCPSPYCGLGADEICKHSLTNDPFSGFKNWGACITKVMLENPKLTKEAAANICGSLKAKHEDLLDLGVMQNITAITSAIQRECSKQDEELKSRSDIDRLKDVMLDGFLSEYTLQSTAKQIDDKIKEILGEL